MRACNNDSALGGDGLDCVIVLSPSDDLDASKPRTESPFPTLPELKPFRRAE